MIICEEKRDDQKKWSDSIWALLGPGETEESRLYAMAFL